MEPVAEPWGGGADGAQPHLRLVEPPLARF